MTKIFKTGPNVEVKIDYLSLRRWSPLILKKEKNQTRKPGERVERPVTLGIMKIHKKKELTPDRDTRECKP